MSQSCISSKTKALSAEGVIYSVSRRLNFSGVKNGFFILLAMGDVLWVQRYYKKYTYASMRRKIIHKIINAIYFIQRTTKNTGQLVSRPVGKRSEQTDHLSLRQLTSILLTINDNSKRVNCLGWESDTSLATQTINTYLKDEKCHIVCTFRTIKATKVTKDNHSVTADNL